MRTEYRDEPCRTALNRTTTARFGFRWTLNPYVGCEHRCTFCYVRGFELRASRPTDDAYGRSIRVKTNIVEVLRRELARRSWRSDVVALGTATDPYQPVEGSRRLSRGCIEALARARTPFNVITRGPLIVRDIDVLQSAAARADVTVSVSVGTLDDRVWKTTEPGTASPRQRLRAVRMLVDAGIACGVSVAPILPGLTDSQEQVDALVGAAREAGATHLWCAPLNLRPGTREHFLARLAEHWPDQVGGYEALFARPYLLPGDAATLTARVHDARDRIGIDDRRARRIEPPPPPRQPRLLA